MKLVSQARQYWTNVEKLMTLRRQELVQTWDEMKSRLQEKYFPVSYKQRLLDQCQCLTQDNQPVTEYVTNFDEFLVRCGENEFDTVVLSRFRSGLRKDFKRELFVQDISTLEHTYQLRFELFVQDITPKIFSFTRRTGYMDNTNKATTVKSPP